MTIYVIITMDFCDIDSDAECQYECPRCQEARYVSEYAIRNDEGDRYMICNRCRENSKARGRKKKVQNTSKDKQ